VLRPGQNVPIGAEARLEDRRRQPAEAATADERPTSMPILAVDPVDGVAMNRLGRAYQDLDYIDDAIAVFTRALTFDPKTRARSDAYAICGGARNASRPLHQALLDMPTSESRLQR